MPTRVTKVKKKVGAADVLGKHRGELIKRWASLFPRSRWTRREARLTSGRGLDAVIEFIKTGNRTSLKGSVSATIGRAGIKGGPLGSGISMVATARKDLYDMLLSSQQLRGKELRTALSRTRRAMDYMVERAAGSRLRSLPDTQELIRRTVYHKVVFENKNIIIFAADPSGHIVLWNEGAERISGIKRRKAVGKSLTSSLLPTGCEAMRLSEGLLARAFSQLAKKCGMAPRHQDFSVTGSVSRVTDDAGHLLGTMGIAFDLTEVKRAENKIAELGQLVDDSSDAIVQTDKNRRIVYWSKGAERIFGYTAKEAQDMHVTSIYKPMSRSSNKANLGRIKDKGTWAGESTAVRKDGKELDVFVSLTAQYSAGGEHIGNIAILTDITEIKKARERIGEQAQLLERTSDAIARVDAKGKITYWNKGVEAMTGYSREETLGKPVDFFERVFPAYGGPKLLGRVRRRGAITVEREGRRKNGKKFVCLFSATPLRSSSGAFEGVLAIGADVTQLRKAEREAQESRAMFETIVDSVPDMVALTAPDDKLIYINKAIEKRTGYSKKDYERMGPPYFAVPQREWKRIAKHHSKILASPGQHRIVVPVPTRHGGERQMEWEATLIKNKNGAPLGVVSVGRDMTERIRAENEQKLLFDMSASLGRSLDIRTVLSEALRRTMGVMGADAGLVATLDESGERLSIFDCLGMEPEVGSVLWDRSPDEGWTGRTMKTGRPTLIRDISSPTYKRWTYGETSRAGYRSFLSLPLCVGNRVLGVFEMASKRPGQFTEANLALGMSMAGIVASAMRNAILHGELTKSHDELADLSRRLESAEEDERRRISAELHDETAQVLAAAKSGLDQLTRQANLKNEEVRRKIEATTRLVSRALTEVRDISHGLHPALLDELGLPSAVRRLAIGVERASGVRVVVRSAGLGERLPSPVEASVFRIVQEVLTNIARHSKATKATVSLSLSDSVVTIAIRDNGIGFDMGKERTRPSGLGLRTLAQRVRWLGGKLELESAPEKGTTVEIHIPVRKHEKD